MKRNAWRTIKSFGNEEAARTRYCRGCIYLGTVGCNGCCNFWEMADRRRGSAFGAKDCPQKILIPGYVIPPEHIEFCQQKDREELERAEAEQKRARSWEDFLRQLGEVDSVPVEKQNRKGRPIGWDTEYAHKLYLDGYYVFEIAEVIGGDPKKIAPYIRNHSWQLDLPPYIERHYHDLDAAKAEYAKYKRLVKEAQKVAEMEERQN